MVSEVYSKSQVDSLMSEIGGRIENVKQIFPIWAEENSSLSANAAEWAFGNGANTPQNQGIPLPVACELFAGSLSMRQGTATVGVYRNGTKVFDIVSAAASNPNNTTVSVPSPISFALGDTIGFRTTSASGTNSPNQVCAWFRVV